VVVVALLVTASAIRHTLMSFFLAFVIAYLLEPVVAFLKRRRLRRLQAIVLIYAVGSILVTFAVLVAFPFLASRWEGLLHDLPLYLQRVRGMVESWRGTILLQWGGSELQWLTERLVAGGEHFLNRLGGGVYDALRSVVFNLFNLILAPILVFFMLFHKDEVIETLEDLLPASRRRAILAVGRELNLSIGAYIRGQLMVSCIVALLSTLSLMALEVDYPLINGLFAGIASFLPFIGVVIALVPPLFFAYAKYQSGALLLKILIAFAVIYFLEGYVVKPVVFKRAMALNPLVTILVVMACGELAGFWGVLLALPLAAAVKIVLRHYRRGAFSAEV
jgi:putative permease